MSREFANLYESNTSQQLRDKLYTMFRGHLWLAASFQEDNCGPIQWRDGTTEHALDFAVQCGVNGYDQQAPPPPIPVDETESLWVVPDSTTPPEPRIINFVDNVCVIHSY